MRLLPQLAVLIFFLVSLRAAPAPAAATLLAEAQAAETRFDTKSALALLLQADAAQQAFASALELPSREKHDLESQARVRAALNRS